MRAAMVVAPGRIEIADRPRPVPGQGEVLLRTVSAAICASDFHTLAGRSDGLSTARPPSDVLGHEAVGVVTDSRAQGFGAGDLVLATPTTDLGRCFADYQCLPARYLVPLPAGPDPANLLMAQQLGTVVYALKQFIPGNVPASAAVLGLGPAGLNFVQLLRHRGVSTIIGSDPCGWRRDAALELGATEVVDPEHEDPVAAIAERTGGQGVELAIEAAGRNVTRRQAMLAVARRGRVGLFGLPEDDDPDVGMPFEQVFHRLLTVHTSANTQGEPGLASFREARDLIAAGAMKPAALISHRYPLERLAEAFRAALQPTPGVRKIVIEISAR